MTDITERLRADIETWEGNYSDEMFVRFYPAPPINLEAADEIVRLRAEVEALRADAAQAVAAERERLAKSLDVIAVYGGNDGRRDWVSAGAWLNEGDVIAVVPRELRDGANK